MAPRARALLTGALWALALALLGLLALVPDLPAQLEALRRAEGALAPGCDAAAGPCALRWADGLALTLRLDPLGMPTNTPITVEVEGPPGALSGGAAVWTGHDMSMGRLALPLAEVAPGRWQARGPLPACVRGAMVWRLDLQLEGPGGPRGAHALLPSGARGG